MNDNFKLTLRPLLSKNGRLTELCEEIVVYRAPFVKVEIHEPQPGLVDGLLKGVRSAAYRRPSQRKSSRAVAISSHHKKPKLSYSAEISGHLDDGSERGKECVFSGSDLSYVNS